MPDFSYDALTSGGTIVRGDMSVGSEAELEDALRGRGEYLVRVLVAPAGPGATPTRTAPITAPTDGPVSNEELLAFSEYLWNSAAAGIPLLTTLHDLQGHLSTARFRRIVAEVADAMSSRGASLSEAMAEHPRAFPEIYVTTVEAGETSGQLDYALEQLVRFLEWRAEVGLHLRQAATYPIIVLLAVVGLVLVLVLFVYPRLGPVLLSFDVELPLATRVVLGTGELLRERWYLLVGGLVGAIAAVRLAYGTTSGRLFLDGMRLRLPLFGKLVYQLEMARVVTYLALFYRTGVDLLRGLDLLARLVTNRRVARAIREARESITHGASLTQAFTATGLFPTVVLRSLALGESTGNLDESLGRVQKYYEREAPAAVKRLMNAMQPLLVLILGGLILVVALSIFLPIMSIYQSLGS